MSDLASNLMFLTPDHNEHRDTVHPRAEAYELKGSAKTKHRKTKKHLRPQRQERFLRVELDASPFKESHEKPHFLLRNTFKNNSTKTSLNAKAKIFVPLKTLALGARSLARDDESCSTYTTSDDENCSMCTSISTIIVYESDAPEATCPPTSPASISSPDPRGFKTQTAAFAATVDLRSTPSRDSTPVWLKNDLTLLQLKGTLRLQLGWTWRDTVDAVLKVYIITPGSISEEVMREGNEGRLLRTLAFCKGNGRLRVYL